MSIVPGGGGEAPTEKGNVLVADHTPVYIDQFKPVWTGSNSVTLPIPAESRVFLEDDEVNGVRIMFRQM